MRGRHQVSTAAPWLQGSTGHLVSTAAPCEQSGHMAARQHRASGLFTYRAVAPIPRQHQPALSLPYAQTKVRSCSAPELLQPQAAPCPGCCAVPDLGRTDMQSRNGSVRANSSTGPAAGTYPSAGTYPDVVSLCAVCSLSAAGPYPFDASLMPSCCRVFSGDSAL